MVNPYLKLIILGLLREGPKHGYQIKKLINEINGMFATVETKSIYYPLKVMEKEGLVRKSVSREGRRPEKFVYHITPKGEKDFHKLVNENFLIFQRPFVNIDLSLYFLPYVDRDLAKERLKVRLKVLKKIEKWLEIQKDKERSSYLSMILEHNKELIEAELNFTQKLITALDYGFSQDTSIQGAS